MSFSSDVKEELSKISNLNKKDQVQMELAGYLISSNTNKNKNIFYYGRMPYSHLINNTDNYFENKQKNLEKIKVLLLVLLKMIKEIKFFIWIEKKLIKEFLLLE